MSKTKVEVIDHPEVELPGGLVNWVYVLSESEDVVLLLVDVKTRHEDVGIFSGTIDENITFWIGRQEIKVTLPFKDGVPVVSHDKYTKVIGFYRKDLLKPFEDGPVDMAWEAPEDVA